MAMPLREPRTALAILMVSATLHSLAPTPSRAAAAEASAAEATLAAMRATVFRQLPDSRPAAETRSGSAGQAEAFVGREDLHAARSFATRPLCMALPGDPLQRIVAHARQTNVVIINEHHASPQDRHFVGRVLAALRPEGYSIYAAETFTRYDSLDHAGVLGSDGWYSSEPIFGRTIALAKSLGYRLVAYERTQQQEEAARTTSSASSHLTRMRERNQADNLMDAVFRANPDARVIVHVGHGHVREHNAQAASTPMMAELLKAATGHDPLTISQTSCQSGSGATEIAATGDGAPAEESGVDLRVGHPALTFQDGRPAWRRAAGDRPAAIPGPFVNVGERTIVEARPWGADLGTVPVDSILLFAGERLPLLLPPGSYRIDAFTKAGRIDVAPVRVDVR